MYDSNSPNEHSSCKKFAFHEATYMRMHVLNPTHAAASWRAGVPLAPITMTAPLHSQTQHLTVMSDAEVCDVVEDTFTFRFDKLYDFVRGHVVDTLRKPRLVLAVGWHEETSTPTGELDVQFQAISVARISFRPHWTAPYLDVCLQTPASRVFQSAFASLATTAALSTALRNIQALPESLEYTTGAGDVFNGAFDRISRGLWDLVDYGKPLLFAGAPLPLVLFVTRKDQGSCSNERK